VTIKADEAANEASEVNMEDMQATLNTDINSSNQDLEESSTPESSEPQLQYGFTQDQLDTISESGETHEFQAEVSRLLDILINSLYTQKEIFLREAVSNAADALDKLRFLSVQDPSVLGSLSDLDVRVDVDREGKTLSITDTGLGMTRQDLVNNLGTIAHTGTTQFLEAIAQGGGLNLIGQFGVGFYSYFLIANKVTVISKHNDDDQYIWESLAGSTFTLVKDPRGNTMDRGTQVVLHLKQDAHEYLDIEKVQGLIKKFSEFITFPIYIKKEKEITKEVEQPEDEKMKDETEDTKDEMEIKDDDEKPEEKNTRTIKEKVWEWELINESKALWLRPREEIEEDEYKKFYQSFTKDYDDPLTWIHFKGEGDVDFNSILYIPKKGSSDMWETGKTSALMKLYVRRVLITDNFDDLMPRYLNFVRGIVDSDDIPLNVNREQLQQLKLMKVIQRRLVRKVLDMVRKLAVAEEDDLPEGKEDMTEAEKEELEKTKEEKKKELQDRYVKFWESFGKNIKLGIIEDAGNRNKLAKLARFYSTYNKDLLTSLDDYIDRAKKSQDAIYFLAGETKDTVLASPLIQGLIKRNYEVLLLDDPIDEYTMQHLSEYEKKKLVNIGKGDFKFPEDEDDKIRIKKLKKMYQPLTEWLKNQYKDKVDTVNVSLKLVEDPMAVVSAEHGYSASMERINKAQAFANKDRGVAPGSMKKVVEINPYHPFIRELLERVKSEVDQDTEESAKLLFEVAMLNSGFQLAETNDFANRFYRVMSDAMGIPRDSKVETFEIEDELPEEETNSNEEAEGEPAMEFNEENSFNGDQDNAENNLGENETDL